MDKEKQKYRVIVNMTSDAMYTLQADNMEDARAKFSELESRNLIGVSTWQYGGKLTQAGAYGGLDHSAEEIEFAESMGARFEDEANLISNIEAIEEMPEETVDPTEVYRRNNAKPKGTDV